MYTRQSRNKPSQSTPPEKPKSFDAVSLLHKLRTSSEGHAINYNIADANHGKEVTNTNATIQLQNKQLRNVWHLWEWLIIKISYLYVYYIFIYKIIYFIFII